MTIHHASLADFLPAGFSSSLQSPGPGQRLEIGQVFSVMPGFYSANVFGDKGLKL